MSADPATLTATVDQLQAEVDALARELLIAMACMLALSILVLVIAWKIRDRDA